MCLICVELDKQAMSVAEARRAFGEMKAAMPPEHAKEVAKKIDDAEREAESKP